MKKSKITKAYKKQKRTPKKKVTKKSIIKKKPLPIPFADVDLTKFKEDFEFDIETSEFIRIKEKVKRKKESGPKIYWTLETERNIKRYINAETPKERNDIFEKDLKFSLEKLVENIINTFKFEYFETDKQDAKKECVSHIVSNLHRFDPVEYSGKSFGYFSVMAKNFFILLNNSNHKKWKLHEQIDPPPSDEYHQPKDFIVEDHVKNKIDDRKEFIKLMLHFWDTNLEKIFSKEGDLKIANAILDMFKFGDVDVYNKKYIYFCIKEMCNCKTQQLTKVINKMKKYHKIIYSDYISNGCIGECIKPSSDYIHEEEEDFEQILTEGKCI